VTGSGELTDRQAREIDYHREHAKLVGNRSGPLSHDVLYSGRRRWWNAYWDIFAFLKAQDLKGKSALVVGCGAGEDAIRLAKLGAKVYAFDLSLDMLNLAKQSAADENVGIEFSQMPAENLSYPDNFFDVVFARDIFHHVDIASAVAELRRVAKNDALFIIDEIYSHSITETVRRSRLVEKVLYPRMMATIYGGRVPYITADERKLSERDVAIIAGSLRLMRKRFFNFVVTRLLPEKSDMVCALDRIALAMLGPLAKFCAGRIVLIGTNDKR
jgi:ubiquinone/menaquinone biosynthesis C-methylase UbiE